MAANDNQFSGGSNGVADVDIAAEQAALANAEAQATATIEAANPTTKVEAAPADDKTPAQKQADEAHKKEETDSEFSYDAFLAEKNTPAKLPEVKPAPAKVQATTTPVATTTEQRDLTGIDASHHDHFKRMSNESFNALKPIYLENAQLKQQLAEKAKGGIPDSYYEHESAYVLTPEFASESAKVTDAETIFSHYDQQLNAVRGGAKTYTVLQRDANGRLVVSAPMQVDRNTEGQFANARSDAYAQLMQTQAKLNTIGELHRQRASEAKSQLTEFESKAFPIFGQKPELKAVVNDTISKVLPAAYRNSPLAPLFAKAVIVMAEQAKHIAALQANGKPTTPTKPATQPSAAEIAGGGAAPSSGSKGEVTFDDFKRAKQGLL